MYGKRAGTQSIWWSMLGGDDTVKMEITLIVSDVSVKMKSESSMGNRYSSWRRGEAVEINRMNVLG